MRFVPATSEAEWDRLVLVHPGGTPFHRWAWLRLQSDAFGWRFRPLLVEHHGEVVGVLPLLRHARASLRGAVPPFPYVGPLVPEELLASTLRAFRREQLRRGVVHVPFDFGPGTGPGVSRVLDSLGWRHRDAPTYVIGVEGRSDEELLAGMSTTLRKHVRRAGRAGITVSTARPGDVAALLPRLGEELWSGRGEPSPYPEDVGARVERWAAGGAPVHTMTAVLDGRAVGVNVLLPHRDTVFAWFGGALREVRDRYPHALLNAELLRWARAEGYARVDLVGHVDDGVARFKVACGAQPVPYVTTAASFLPPGAVSAARAVRSALRTTATRTDPARRGLD